MSDLKKKLVSAVLKMDKVHVPELNVDVYLKRLNGNERDIFQAAQAKALLAEKTEGTAAFLPLFPLLLLLSLRDEDGEQIFSDIKEIKEMDGIIIDRLATKALDVNGFTQESRAEIEKKASATAGSTTT